MKILTIVISIVSFAFAVYFRYKNYSLLKNNIELDLQDIEAKIFRNNKYSLYLTIAASLLIFSLRFL